jgi:fimbrial chaperone protein
MSIRIIATRIILTAVFVSPCAMPQAASLQIAPVTVDVAAPGATATLNLRNPGDKPLDGQVRVFKWTQVDGEDKLVPTEDVVASPPMVTLRPNTNYVVRVVRTTKEPVAGEETYRLLIDELPGPAAERRTAVNIVLRYSIPVFFTAPGAVAGKLKWALQHRNNKLFLSATNDGDRRVRIAKLKITDTKGATASFGEGLAGYVLGHSTKIWPVSAKAKGFGSGGLASISAESDLGPINAKP